MPVGVGQRAMLDGHTEVLVKYVSLFLGILNHLSLFFIFSLSTFSQTCFVAIKRTLCSDMVANAFCCGYGRVFSQHLPPHVSYLNCFFIFIPLGILDQSGLCPMLTKATRSSPLGKVGLHTPTCNERRPMTGLAFSFQRRSENMVVKLMVRHKNVI